jgi:hypothetical protein
MNTLNKKIVISLGLVIILSFLGGFWWWQAQGEPDDLLVQIRRDLAEYEQIIDDCKDVSNADDAEKCTEKMDEIENNLIAYETELLRLQTGQMAAVGELTATSTR